MQRKKHHSKKSTGHEPPPVWRETHTIRPDEVDIRGNLSALALCNMMQNAAGNHAHALGLALQDLLTVQHTWVLSRLAVHMETFPGWQDEITIETWPAGIDRLFALRDFRFLGHDGRAYGRGASAWVMIDTESRRPVRVRPFLEKAIKKYPERAGTDDLEKLPTLEEHEFETTFFVRFSDLDVNQHVNNVSYIAWVIESVPDEVLQTHVLLNLEINFLAETFFRERVISRCASLDAPGTCFRHSIIRKDSGREIVRAQTEWHIPR